MTEAVQANDQEAFSRAFGDLAEAVEQNIMAEVQALQDAQDNSILTARGCRVLTSQERQYCEAVIGAMKSDDPKQALTNINKVLPETVVDAVFEDLVSSHPLLAAINFQSTGALVKILLSTTGGAAAWGPIGKTITEELSANFIELDLSLASLTAFLPVNRYMLDLGPAWLDRYIRETAFCDGLVAIYAVENRSEPGGKPREALWKKGVLRFQRRTVGIRRHYTALNAGARVDLLLRCPYRPEVSTQDVAVPTVDGRQYRIALVQVPEDHSPPVMDLTLERLERDYDMPG